MDNEAIEAAAAEWIIRRSGDSWTDADQKRLESWLNESTFHRVIYLRLDALWKQTALLETSGALPSRYAGSLEGQEAHMPEGTAAERKSRPSQAWRRLQQAARHALATSAPIYRSIQPYDGGRYATAVGGLYTVQLPDGSVRTRNTDTSVRVHLGPSERRVDLNIGEAHFVVARDPERPFVTWVERRSLTTFGSEFCVRRIGQELQVLVTEGLVELCDSAGIRKQVTIVSAGSLGRTVGVRALITRISDSDAQRYLAWRGGFVIFRDTPLGEAAAEFNRYQMRKLVIKDSSLALMSVNGRFRTSNLAGFLVLVQLRLPILVQKHGNRIVLTRRA